MNDSDLGALKCATKISFETRVSAQAAATQAEHFYGTKLKIYQCRECHLWHLSSDSVK